MPNKKKFSLRLEPFRKFSPLKFLTKKQVLVLEIGEEWLKMVGVDEMAGARKVRCLAVEPVKGIPDLDLARKITQFLQLHKFKPQRVILSQPAHQVTTRILALPSTDPQEIKDIVELQAVKQTPYTREEITTGFHIIDQDTTGYSRVLVAISHRDLSARSCRIVELANLTVTQVTLSIEGTWHWFSRRRSREAASEENVLLLDMDALTTELLIFHQAKLIFSRSLGIGAKPFLEQGTLVEPEFVREVQRSMESSGPELKGGGISRIVLTGVSQPLKNISALLARELTLPCEAVSVSQPFGSQDLESKVSTYSNLPASFVSVLGLAFYPEITASMNLIPPEIQIRKSLEERAKDLAFLGTLLLALVTFFSLLGFEKVYKKNLYLAALKKDYNAISAKAEELGRWIAKMEVAQAQRNAGPSFLDVMRDVNEVIPDNITLTSLQYQRAERSVVVRGISEEMSPVFQFLSTLEGIPSLESVKTRNVTKQKVGEKDVNEFEVVAQISGGLSGVNSL